MKKTLLVTIIGIFLVVGALHSRTVSQAYSDSIDSTRITLPRDSTFHAEQNAPQNIPKDSISSKGQSRPISNGLSSQNVIQTKSERADSALAGPKRDSAFSGVQNNPQNISYRDTIPSKEQAIPQAANDTTSLSFKDTDIRDIFRALSYQHGLNIFVDNSINKRTTISLNQVRVYDAIRFLCSQNNLVLELEGGIFKITPPPQAKVIPPPPKVPFIYYDNTGLSVELKNDDLEEVVLDIQKKAKKNILILNGTSGTLTGKLTDVDFDIGFTQLMNNNGFAVQEKNNIYTVSRLDYFVGQQTSSQNQKNGPYWISVKDSLVTIDVTNAPLDRVLGDIIRQLNTDLVQYNAITGNVTARATNVSLTTALDMLLRNTNFTYRENDGIYFVGEKANKALLTTRLVKLKYLRAEKIVDLIPQSISAQATLKPMKEQNGLIIVGAGDVVSQLEEYIQVIDKPVAQVLIEALVVDYDLTNGSQIGVGAGYKTAADTTTPSASLIPGLDIQMSGSTINAALQGAGTISLLGKDIGIASLGKLPGDFYLNLKAMEQKGLANVRSRPLLATINGYPATLSIGTTQYFLLNTTTPYASQSNSVVLQQSQSFQTIEANVKLELTPYVGANGLIVVDIKPDFKTPVGQLSPNVPPTINQRSMSSTVEVKEGETIVLGGMIQETESDNRTQVPILGSIPLLGGLFSSTTKSKEKSELIIYITPHISYGEAFQSVYLPEESK